MDEINTQAPDVLGISVYIWNNVKVRELLSGVRALLPRCIIVLGGPEVSYNADQWLQDHPEIDYIVRGPGEAGLRKLLVSNLSLEEKIISVPNPPFQDIPFPYQDGDFEQFKNRYVYYEASRGCPYRCSYCLSSRRDQSLEYRDGEMVKTELRYLLSKGPGTVKFVDRTFNADRHFAREIWRFLLENPSQTMFHFEIFPDLLEEEDFTLLSGVPPGSFQFEIGIQSTNPDTLKEINRPNDWNTVSANIHRLVGQGNIHIHLDLIAGLPCEGLESFISSFNKVYALGGHYIQLGFLKILPGTEMEARKHQYGIEHLKTPPYTVRETRWLSRENLGILKKVEYALNYLYNSSRFSSTLSLLATQFNSPFEMYLRLADFLNRKDRKRIPRDWPTGARAIMRMVDQHMPCSASDILPVSYTHLTLPAKRIV